MTPHLLSFLSELKSEGIQRKVPNISESTAEMIHFLIKLHGGKNMLEIGTANGYSTIWCANAMAENGGSIDTLEFSTPSWKEAQENFKKAEALNITSHFGDAREYLKRCEKVYDIVFIDAQKAEYKTYWDLLQPILAKNCLVIVDDIIKFPEKTRAFTDYIKNQNEFEYCIIPVDGDDGVMLIKRRLRQV